MAGTGEPIADWFSRVVRLHDWIVGRYGGVPGILNESILHAAIERPWTGLADGTQCFPSVLDKAAVLLERLINYHPFVDGNKRTATMLTLEFLRQQGYFPETESAEIVAAAVRIAEKKLVQSDIVAWLDRITPVRLRRFDKSSPCPWCGSDGVQSLSADFATAADNVGPNGILPEVHFSEYWKCHACQVEFMAGDRVLLVDGLTYLLHVYHYGGDPLAKRVVTGPWWTEHGGAPQYPGGIILVAGVDVSRAAYDYPTQHVTEVVAALRAKLRH